MEREWEKEVERGRKIKKGKGGGLASVRVG